MIKWEIGTPFTGFEHIKQLRLEDQYRVFGGKEQYEKNVAFQEKLFETFKNKTP
jgi:flagellar assembly factor FliW